MYDCDYQVDNIPKKGTEITQWNIFGLVSGNALKSNKKIRTAAGLYHCDETGAVSRVCCPSPITVFANHYTYNTLLIQCLLFQMVCSSYYHTPDEISTLLPN